jgi:anthranilate phosphoribosyltransferase
VLLTSAAALYLVGTARSFSLGVDLAAETLDRGRAARLLADLRRLARRYPKEAT